MSGDDMTSAGRCPRGHELAENAVYCTVCWIRVEPEDPARVAARQRRRRRIWIPLLATSSILIGVVIGGAMGAGSAGSEGSIVAQDAAETVGTANPEPSAQASPETSAEALPVDSGVTPLAATVVEESPVGSCSAEVLGQTVPCTDPADALAFTICVPDGTARVKVSTRESADADWQPVSSDATFGSAADCSAGSVAAEITVFEAVAGTPEATWRLAGRDDINEKLWKSRLVVTVAS
jgi:hypothetical protein